MNLKTFNRVTVPQRSKTNKPFITMNHKIGVCFISTGAIKLMGLQEGDMIQLHQSEDEPRDWFVEKIKKDGFSLRFNHNKTGLMFNCAALVNAIFESIEFEGKSARFQIGESVKIDKRVLFTLITANV